MIRTLGLALALSLILLGIATASEPSSEAVEFLRMQASIIKGDIQPPQIQSDTPPPKCGTPVMLAAYTMAQRTDDQALKALQARPSPDSLPLSFGSEHFIVHYAASGSNAPYHPTEDINPADSIPDYINRASEIFEYVWQKEIDSLGYDTPPTDQGRGGDDRYDIYIENLGFGYFGFTNPEEVVEIYRAFSFIEIENDFQESPTYRNNPIAALQVTAAHEFFHAIQFGYDAFEFDFDDPDNPLTYKPWWMEASSTWMEDIVYDDVNDYLGYLHFFYKYIWMSLTTFSYGGDVRAFHPYASCVWPIFLTEKFSDPGIIREIWDECGAVQGYNTLPATDDVLHRRGSAIGEAFLEFEVWNFHTGDLADTAVFFSEGNSFPAAETTFFIADLENHSSVLVPNSIQYPEQYATNYVIVETRQDLPGGMVVNFDGQSFSGQNWRTALLGYKYNDSRWQDMEIEPSSGDGSDAWLGWNTYRDIILISTVTGLDPNPNRFVYTAELSFDPSLIGGGTPGFAVDDAYPSPYLISSMELIRIPYSLDKTYSKGDLSLRIYDVGGLLVREIFGEYFPFTDPGNYHRGIPWDGKNSSGELVASGVYIYLLSAGDKSGKGKIAVVNNTK